MSEMVRDLLVLVAIVAPIVGYAAGRIVEHRVWRSQRDGLYAHIAVITHKLGEARSGEADTLAIIRDQRHLLNVLTAAAEQTAREPGPVTEARHRLTWAAAKARTELL